MLITQPDIMEKWSFTFAGQQLYLLPEKAIWWPDQELLLVADLHLEKGSAYARRGQLLPPYDSHETLVRLFGLVCHFGPKRLVCLGDSVHDRAGMARLMPESRAVLTEIAVLTKIMWIEGNHDGQTAGGGATTYDQLTIGGIVLAHEPIANAPAQIIGHYHPKFMIAARRQKVSRPCFAANENTLVMPAFGAFTGGLRTDHPEFRRILGSSATAIVATSQGIAQFAL